MASLAPLCAVQGRRHLVEVELDCAFAANYYEALGRRAGGWVPRAVVATVNKRKFVKSYSAADSLAKLVASVHRWSRHPVFVFATAGSPPRSELLQRLTPGDHPRAVLFWLHPPTDTLGQFTFVKLRAMLLGWARCAVVLEGDMIVGPLIDRLLDRAALHSGPEYPYPILPTMNLGHNNPTYTFHALQFVAELYQDALDASSTWSTGAMGNDWLSRPKFAGRLVKQWCKWDVEALPVLELLKHDFDVNGGTTFVAHASSHPVVFGYAVHAPESSMSRRDMDRAETAIANVSQERAAAHWLLFDKTWYTSGVDVVPLRLECIV